MLTQIERLQIVDALHTWAKSVPNEPVVGFAGKDGFLTPYEIVEQVEIDSQLGQAVLSILEHGMRREGIEAVVSRFGGQSLGRSKSR